MKATKIFIRFCLPLSLINLIMVNLEARPIRENLYINRGVFETVKKTTFPFITYNQTASFKPNNTVVKMKVVDTIMFLIHNMDSVKHGFAIKNFKNQTASILPGMMDSVLFFANEDGIWIYYDPYENPKNRYLGAAGMIVVNNLSGKSFFWNLKEHQTLFNKNLGENKSVNFKAYEPDYFTINGKSFPDLQKDSTAAVKANVGDTVLIFISNTGQSVHAIHFHGFHCKTLFSTSKLIGKGWIKDSFSIHSMEGLVLQLVPDKKGSYSVHDHNLVAVSGGGTHPNGMFLIMEIE